MNVREKKRLWMYGRRRCCECTGEEEAVDVRGEEDAMDV